MTGYVLRRLLWNLDEIVKLYEQGASFEEIAVRFQCGPSTVRRLFIKEGIPHRPGGLIGKLYPVEAEIRQALERGDDVKTIAARFGVKPATVSRFLLMRTNNLRNDNKGVEV